MAAQTVETWDPSENSDAEDVSSKHMSTQNSFSDHSHNESIGRRETKAVRRIRTFLLLILVVAVVAAVGVYIFTSRAEETDFEEAFVSQGEKVMRAFQDDSYRKLQALDTLSNSFTSYAKNTGSKWPFVTIPDSASHFESYLSLTNAVSLTILPIVGVRERLEWEDYTVANQKWLDEDLEFEERKQQSERKLQVNAENVNEDVSMSAYIKNYVGIDTSQGPWVVWWQYSPVIANRYFVNFNRLAVDDFEKAADALQAKKAVLSRTWSFQADMDLQSARDFAFTKQLLAAGGYGNYQGGEPIGYIYYPVFDRHEGEQETVAILSATVYWRTYFLDTLPNGVNGIRAVVENSQGQMFTYEINGADAVYLGMEDHHDLAFEGFALSAGYSDFMANAGSGGAEKYTGVPVNDEYLSYRIRVYPTEEFKQMYLTNNPLIYSSLMAIVFLATAAIFLVYDWLVERRQKIVMESAAKNQAIVSSLFPENVRERLMDEALKQMGASPDQADLSSRFDQKEGLIQVKSTKPIADFFPACTILFADIEGFTAWSSTREASQVFVLLESIYSAFDAIAKQRRIFKVETIGDCYVAASGIPVPRDDHAVAACRFALQCLHKVENLTRQLEVQLGPGTGDLSMRFGIHSGAVIAGVLRGDKSRFQLFGDTINTAARMESTGVKGRVQLSEETAELLKSADKGHWIVPRHETVYAKGKGELNTYFLKTGDSKVNFDDSQHSSKEMSIYSSIHGQPLPNSDSRLIDWNVCLMGRLLQQIVARREARGWARLTPASSSSTMPDPNLWRRDSREQQYVIDEVQEVIKLPDFQTYTNQRDPDTVDLGEAVTSQLFSYVSSVCHMYRKENPFHNFEHASHVTVSVSKMLNRIIAPTDIQYNHKSSIDLIALDLHDHTYGITSDPLTQFACIFSALIHDADHPGVPNSQLVKEATALARVYDNKSIAEQNSVDICWDLLMENDFVDLRKCICATPVEMVRFRQLVVNSVMATDVMDKSLKALRDKRWEKAFSSTDPALNADRVNRKATIVIEHLIQSSDVAHTMQHWHVYRKWNAKLFQEMYVAWKQGRATADPSEFWYKGELGFFDFYIIPLAKKLKDCGVFGVSSDECLVYAERNRAEWEQRGLQIVEELKEMVANVVIPSKHSESSTSSDGTSSEASFQ